jgi:hypothetical protein
MATLDGAERQRRGEQVSRLDTADDLDRILLTCGFVAPIIFVSSFVLQGMVRPGYSPLRHPVSSLALAYPAGWVQPMTFVVTGALLVGFAIGLRRRRVGWAAPILIGLVGVGLCGAGLFPSDPISGFPPGAAATSPRTVHGVVHDLLSTPVFTALPAACLVMARRFARGDHTRWVVYSVVTAAVLWASFVLASVGFAQVSALVAWGVSGSALPSSRDWRGSFFSPGTFSAAASSS